MANLVTFVEEWPSDEYGAGTFLSSHLIDISVAINQSQVAISELIKR